MDGSQIEVGGPSEGHCGLIKWYVVVLKVRSVDPQRDTVGLSSGLWKWSLVVLKVRSGDPQRDTVDLSSGSWWFSKWDGSKQVYRLEYIHFEKLIIPNIFWIIHSLYILNEYIKNGGLNYHVKLDQSSKYPFIGPGGTLHTYIFWTYRTDKTCSFWTEMTIYEHGKHITTPIGPGLIFCTYRTKRPIHSGLDWPYKVIR